MKFIQITWSQKLGSNLLSAMLNMGNIDLGLRFNFYSHSI